MIKDFILIIGAMKSGTTTLYNYLAQHPQIAIGRYKEPSFFAFEEQWALGFEWYESQFNYDPKQHHYALDGSTDYTKHPFCKDVAQRIKSSAPRKFKLIYIMRHPLRRIESHAQHVDRLKAEVGRCRSPRESHSLDAGISPVSMAITRYAHQIDQYADYFDKGDLLLLTLEQLSREPAANLRKVYQFLEIEPILVCETPLVSNKANSHSVSNPKGTWLYSFWQTLRRNDPLHHAAMTVIPKSTRARIYELVQVSAPQLGRFVLNQEESLNLIAELKSDLIRLKNKYGVDAEKEWGIDL